MGLIRILMYGAVAMLAYVMFKRLIAGPRGRNRLHPDAEDERIGRLEQDPYCEVYVDSKDAIRRKGPDGPVFFCSKACADAYAKEQRGAT